MMLAEQERILAERDAALKKLEHLHSKKNLTTEEVLEEFKANVDLFEGDDEWDEEEMTGPAWEKTLEVMQRWKDSLLKKW